MNAQNLSVARERVTNRIDAQLLELEFLLGHAKEARQFDWGHQGVLAWTAEKLDAVIEALRAAR